MGEQNSKDISSENLERRFINESTIAPLFRDDSRLKCFVMMPFGQKGEYPNGVRESDYVYNQIIRKSITEIETTKGINIQVIREADKKASGSISKSILKNIASADICIVDIKGLNPNVFFELGIRYSLRHKTTILLKQEQTQIPFDIQGYKCITYDCFKPDVVIASIIDCLTTSLTEYAAIDSLVFETFPSMQVNIPDVVDSAIDPTNDHNTMLWSEWWARINDMSVLLRDSFDNGRFVPTVVLGISNGGLLVADSLGREVFKTIPILSLWANRWQKEKTVADPSCYIFDNDFNRATIQQIKTYAGKNKITVLLVDDIVFTSNTIFQATAFLEKEFVENYEILFTPMYCRETDHLKSIEEILPMGYRKGKVIGISEKDYHERLATSRSFLPYGKAIGRE